ncbi:hypothetical protein DPMN_143052 [Dreissena polymorpha]|uniref:Uncharacterized protein n=1 Tax=Dreissena polymorpha TaxID=45954 RepID=A0A9D4JJQ5_DREPO|nr:hypothetical protein DPMN_143052 [Dreissena polymorpha]
MLSAACAKQWTTSAVKKHVGVACSGGQTCCNPHTSHQTQTVTNEEDEEEGGDTNLREEVADEVDEGLNDDTVEEDGENEWD